MYVCMHGCMYEFTKCQSHFCHLPCVCFAFVTFVTLVSILAFFCIISVLFIGHRHKFSHIFWFVFRYYTQPQSFSCFPFSLTLSLYHFHVFFAFVLYKWFCDPDLVTCWQPSHWITAQCMCRVCVCIFVCKMKKCEKQNDTVYVWKGQIKVNSSHPIQCRRLKRRTIDYGFFSRVCVYMIVAVVCVCEFFFVHFICLNMCVHTRQYTRV